MGICFGRGTRRAVCCVIALTVFLVGCVSVTGSLAVATPPTWAPLARNAGADCVDLSGSYEWIGQAVSANRPQPFPVHGVPFLEMYALSMAVPIRDAGFTHVTAGPMRNSRMRVAYYVADRLILERDLVRDRDFRCTSDGGIQFGIGYPLKAAILRKATDGSLAEEYSGVGCEMAFGYHCTGHAFKARWRRREGAQ